MHHKTLNIVLADQIKIPHHDVAPLVMRKIQERLVFTNPEYEARHLRGDWIGGIQPQISCIRKAGRYYLLPRGFLEQLLDLCHKFQQPVRIVDRRRKLPHVPMEFHGELKDYQQEAAEGILEKDFATLVGGYKSGKTVIALYTIAQRRQPTLVMIPRLDLLDGWVTKIVNFLQIPEEEIGFFIHGRHRVGRRITVGHTGEMIRAWRKIREHIGYVVLDECQRAPAKAFTHLMPNFDTHYMLGLANTTQRRDHLSRFIYYYLGDVVYSINDKDAREGRGIIRAHVVARSTDFHYPYESRTDYSAMMDALMADESRTRLIADDIEEEMQQRHEPLLVVTGGGAQDRVLGRELERRGIATFIPSLTEGEQSLDGDERSLTEDDGCLDIPTEKPVAVFVTPDVLTRCSHRIMSQVVFLAYPLFFRRGLTYAIRDLVPNTNGARLTIYDYVDQKVRLLENYFRLRSYNYGVHPDILLNAN